MANPRPTPSDPVARGIVLDHVDVHRLVLVSNPRSGRNKFGKTKIQTKLWRKIRRAIIHGIMPTDERRAMPRKLKIADREGND